MLDDALIDEYARRLAPVRETYLADQADLEARAAAGIDREATELRGLISDAPMAFVEHLWITWLDKRLFALREQYYRKAAEISREVFGGKHDGGHR